MPSVGDPGRADILFLAGLDWRYLIDNGFDALPNPRINLIQHVRHAHEGTELHGYLRQRAVRICVSEEVAQALYATGQVNGPGVHHRQRHAYAACDRSASLRGRPAATPAPLRHRGRLQAPGTRESPLGMPN